MLRPDSALQKTGLFIRFLLSPEGQRIFADLGYYPVIPGSP